MSKSTERTRTMALDRNLKNFAQIEEVMEVLGVELGTKERISMHFMRYVSVRSLAISVVTAHFQASMAASW